jgi:hypothetical protein
MSGDHAKREIMTGEKATSSGRTLSKGFRQQTQGGILFLHQVASER